jgi:DNA polymerase-3 subunit alpha
MVEFDCVTIEVSKLERLAVIEDPRYSEEKKALPLTPLPRRKGKLEALNRV